MCVLQVIAFFSSKLEKAGPGPYSSAFVLESISQGAMAWPKNRLRVRSAREEGWEEEKRGLRRRRREGWGGGEERVGEEEKRGLRKEKRGLRKEKTGWGGGEEKGGRRSDVWEEKEVKRGRIGEEKGELGNKEK